MSVEASLGDFVAVCRRAGIPASPVESIDVERAAMAVGLGDKAVLRAALRSVLVKEPSHLSAFDRSFDAFFRVEGGGAPGLSARLGEAPLTDDELRALLEAIGAAERAREGAASLGAVAEGGAALDQMLRDAAARADVGSMQSSMQVGYFTQRTLELAGVEAMRERLEDVRAELAARLGEARADELALALDRELDALRGAARALVQAELARRNALDRDLFRRRMLEERRFVDLRQDEVRALVVEVRRLAERLRGKAAVRRKRKKRGTLDVRKTLRRAHRTFGIPFTPVMKRRVKERPKLTVLCDVSDSVRFAARFLLMLTWALQDVFQKTRTFAFVSDLGETTHLFREHPLDEAIELVYGGAAVSVASGSDYGKALGVFASRFMDAVDPRTTLVLVGDARTNYLDPNVAALRKIAARAERVFFLNPEPRPSWGFGDSVMPAYRALVDEALPVSDLASLRVAVDRLLPR